LKGKKGSSKETQRLILEMKKTKQRRHANKKDERSRGRQDQRRGLAHLRNAFSGKEVPPSREIGWNAREGLSMRKITILKGGGSEET